MRTCILAAFLTCLMAADQPQVYPDWPAAPVAPVKPTPTPAPVKDASKLAYGELFVVQSDDEVQLLGSPDGRISIVDVGPGTVYGKFVDGNGKNQARKYTKKHVFVVERIADGEVELLQTPKGPVVRRTLDGGGVAPVPIPTPTDPLVPVLQSAYNVEDATTRAADKPKLAKALRAVAADIKNPVYKTGQQFHDVLSDTISGLIEQRLKVKLRPTIGEELDKILPVGKGAANIPLTDAHKDAAKTLLNRIADLLDKEVK